MCAHESCIHPVNVSFSTQYKDMHPFKQPQITRRISSLQTPPPQKEETNIVFYLPTDEQ